MDTQKTFVERRKHKRYRSQICIYTVIRSPENTIGQLIDISLSGLALNYLSANSKPMRSSIFDLLAEEGLYIPNIPYEQIDDFVIHHELPCCQFMHRHAVKFNGLTDSQVIQIHSLVSKHGIHVIPDEVIERADKCPHNFSCLETGKCFCACEVDHVHGKDILILESHSLEAGLCPNYFNFEGNDVCICPVHYHLHQFCREN